MKVGVIGLGRMGAALAYRLHKAGFEVYGYDPSQHAQAEAHADGVIICDSLEKLAHETHVIWFMVPAGDLMDQILQKIDTELSAGDIVIDGGNSYFKDSIRRAQKLQEKGVHFLDCGTSGGIHGKEKGFCLMIGGKKEIYADMQPLFKAVSAPEGYGYMGPSGAGHYVKMIHNGIEYGMLQAYGEGFELLREGDYKQLDLAEISRVWSHGSVIRSWLLDLAHDVFEQDQQLQKVSGEVAEGGTGAWTVQTARENKIPVPVIEASLKVRAESRKTGGSFATKVIAMLRKGFGGHAVKKI